MKKIPSLFPVLFVLLPACTRSVVATDAADAAVRWDSVEATRDDSVMDAVDTPDALLLDVRDAGSDFDPRDSGRCDPRRIRARNTGRACWIRTPDAPWLDCQTFGFTCQEGVCCSGRINPETCDCECPEVDAGVCDLPNNFPYAMCCLAWGHDLPDPQTPTCNPPGEQECIQTRAIVDWQTAQRDR